MQVVERNGGKATRCEELLLERIDLAKPEIDLRECGFVQPEGALGLFLILMHYVKQHKRPIVRRPKDEDFGVYKGFGRGCPLDQYTGSGNSGYIC
jgi:hypothetical protein